MKKYLLFILVILISISFNSCLSTKKAKRSQNCNYFSYSHILIFINGETNFSFDRRKKIYEEGVVSINNEKVKCRGHKYKLISLCDSTLVAQDAFTTIQYYR